MKKLLATGLLLLGACRPNIADDPGPAPSIVVELDLNASPAVAPVPNDLALSPTTGLVVFPPPAQTQTAAQTEFNNSYLATLAGFPFESSLQVLVTGALDPSTVTAQSVVVVDLTTAAVMPASAIVTGLMPTFDPTANAIDVANPAGWTRAHRYAVVLIAADAANPAGLRGAHGEPVIGSPTWGLLSSPNPLVKCPTAPSGTPDLTSASCTLAVDVIPSTETDPTAKLQDQLQKAEQLEPIREGYASLYQNVLLPLLQVDLTRIPIFWTFTIVDAGEVTFDPAHAVIPFPNDVLRSPTTGNVSLPNPLTGAPLTASDCAAPTNANIQLYCGLNTLDGFSTIAAPISQNGLDTNAVTQASVDPTTLSTADMGLVPIVSNAPTGEQTPSVEFTPCLNCLSSPSAAGVPQTSPQELQWQLNAPLDEKTTYLAYVTTNVKDTQGKAVIPNPVFALLRLTNPLVDANGTSQVNVLSDAQAQQLEPLRAALAPALTALGTLGVSRQSIALAWAFTTQSEASDLDALYAYVSAPASAQTVQGALPQGPVVFADATAQYDMAAGGAANLPDIAKFYSGIFETPYAVTGPGGTLDVAAPTPEPIEFALSVPSVPPPANGYPVTIFGHGLTRDRNDFLAIADALAKAGQVAIATDAPLHGERSSCTGSGTYLAVTLKLSSVSDDNACQNPVTMMCNEDPLIGRCVARPTTPRIACPGLDVANAVDPTGNLGCMAARLGACEADGLCEGGDFLRDADLPGTTSTSLRPVISGWNIFSLTNFFATRDNFRQQVIDLTELVHLLGVAGSSSVSTKIAAVGGTAPLDLTKINYVGQSLGGILGTLFNAVSPDTKNVVLNVPGGDLPSIILQAPSFALDKAAVQATLALGGILQGTPAYDQFFATAQWILDPADPANMAWRLTHPATLASGIKSPNVNRNVFIQFIQGDETVPNVSNLAELEAAVRPPLPLPATYVARTFGCMPPLYCYEFTDAIEGFTTTTVPPDDRHGFLLSPPSDAATPSAQALALTVKAQTQVATFVTTGTVPQ